MLGEVLQQAVKVIEAKGGAVYLPETRRDPFVCMPPPPKPSGTMPIGFSRYYDGRTAVQQWVGRPISDRVPLRNGAVLGRWCQDAEDNRFAHPYQVLEPADQVLGHGATAPPGDPVGRSCRS